MRVNLRAIRPTEYAGHEFDEEVLPVIKFAQKSLLGSPIDLAVNSAHGVAFHRGLGTPLHPTSSSPLSKYLNVRDLKLYSKAAYAKPNIAVVANGASYDELSKWVNQFFTDVPSSHPAFVPKLEYPATKYYGGEERIAHDSGNVMIVAFPGSSSFTSGGSYKPEMSVLAALLGGQSTIKWSTGFSLLSKAAAQHPQAQASTTNAAYSDAGLFYITATGNSRHVRAVIKDAVKIIQSVAAGEVSQEDIRKAVALAKFRTLEAGQNTQAGMEATGAGLIQGGKPFQIDEVGKSIDSVSAEQVKKVRLGVPAIRD